MTIDFAEVVDAADVGMGDLARDANFIAEAVERLRIIGGLRREEFQRDCLAQHQIVGAIHLPHAALPEFRDNAISSGEESAGQESAVGG